MSTSTRTARRTGIALVGALLVPAGVLSAPTAVASTGDDTYVPEPAIRVEHHQPVCDGDVPYLEYRVVADGTAATTMTIVWRNPTGDDVVLTGQPLEGRTPWPGAVVDAEGRGVDWPGWRLEDGEWVEGDEFDWVRPSVEVEFQVNPVATVTVDFPASSPDCATNPPGEEDPAEPAAVAVSDRDPAASRDGGLAVTGATVGTVAALAAALLAIGASVVLVARRRGQRG